MSASNKLIQVKNLIRQILKTDEGKKKIPSEDTAILQDFLEGKATVADTIKSIRNIKKLQIN